MLEKQSGRMAFEGVRSQWVVAKPCASIFNWGEWEHTGLSNALHAILPGPIASIYFIFELQLPLHYISVTSIELLEFNFGICNMGRGRAVLGFLFYPL